jgi:hypothetical protein
VRGGVGRAYECGCDLDLVETGRVEALSCLSFDMPVFEARALLHQETIKNVQLENYHECLELEDASEEKWPIILP